MGSSPSSGTTPLTVSVFYTNLRVFMSRRGYMKVMAASSITSFPNAVLVVDDEPTTLKLFAAVLRQRGLACRTAHTGETAIALLEREGFGCLLVDKNLPGVDGLEVIRAAMARQPYCASLMMTAYPTADSVVQALQLGATDYLVKPFEELELVLEKIDKAMRHQRSLFERETLHQRLRDTQDSVECWRERAAHLETLLQTTCQLAHSVIATTEPVLRAIDEGTQGAPRNLVQLKESAQRLYAHLEVVKYTEGAAQ